MGQGKCLLSAGFSGQFNLLAILIHRALHPAELHQLPVRAVGGDGGAGVEVHVLLGDAGLGLRGFRDDVCPCAIICRPAVSPLEGEFHLHLFQHPLEGGGLPDLGQAHRGVVGGAVGDHAAIIDAGVCDIAIVVGGTVSARVFVGAFLNLTVFAHPAEDLLIVDRPAGHGLLQEVHVPVAVRVVLGEGEGVVWDTQRVSVRNQVAVLILHLLLFRHDHVVVTAVHGGGAVEIGVLPVAVELEGDGGALIERRLVLPLLGGGEAGCAGEGQIQGAAGQQLGVVLGVVGLAGVVEPGLEVVVFQNIGETQLHVCGGGAVRIFGQIHRIVDQTAVRVVLGNTGHGDRSVVGIVFVWPAGDIGQRPVLVKFSQGAEVFIAAVNRKVFQDRVCHALNSILLPQGAPQEVNVELKVGELDIVPSAVLISGLIAVHLGGRGWSRAAVQAEGPLDVVGHSRDFGAFINNLYLCGQVLVD